MLSEGCNGVWGWVLSALERSRGADHVVFQELVKKNHVLRAEGHRISC